MGKNTIGEQCGTCEHYIPLPNPVIISECPSDFTTGDFDPNTFVAKEYERTTDEWMKCVRGTCPYRKKPFSYWSQNICKRHINRYRDAIDL